MLKARVRGARKHELGQAKLFYPTESLKDGVVNGRVNQRGERHVAVNLVSYNERFHAALKAPIAFSMRRVTVSLP